MSTARKVLRLAGLWSLLGALFATQAFIGSHYSTIPLSWAESFGVAFIAWYVRGLLAIPRSGWRRDLRITLSRTHRSRLASLLGQAF